MSTALRFICIAVLFTPHASPQIATTADGRSVYFAISGVRQRGSNQSFDAKLFLTPHRQYCLLSRDRQGAVWPRLTLSDPLQVLPRLIAFSPETEKIGNPHA